MNRPEYIPGTIVGTGTLHLLATRLRMQASLLEIHLREMANNGRLLHHKGTRKARQREVTLLRELLDVIEKALSEGEQGEAIP